MPDRHSPDRHSPDRQRIVRARRLGQDLEWLKHLGCGTQRRVHILEPKRARRLCLSSSRLVTCSSAKKEFHSHWTLTRTLWFTALSATFFIPPPRSPHQFREKTPSRKDYELPEPPRPEPRMNFCSRHQRSTISGLLFLCDLAPFRATFLLSSSCFPRPC